jgi:hypothetical protein
LVFLNPIFTQVKIDSPIFIEGITQGDTLKELDWDFQVMCEGICDTHPTLVKTWSKVFPFLFIVTLGPKRERKQ